MDFRCFVISSLRKVHDPLFPFTQGCFVPSLVEIVVMVLGKKIKMSKISVRTEVSLNGLYINEGFHHVCRDCFKSSSLTKYMTHEHQ